MSKNLSDKSCRS